MNNTPAIETVDNAIASVEGLAEYPAAAARLRAAHRVSPGALAAEASKLNMRLARDLQDREYIDKAHSATQTASNCLSALVREIIQ